MTTVMLFSTVLSVLALVVLPIARYKSFKSAVHGLPTNSLNGWRHGSPRLTSLFTKRNGRPKFPMAPVEQPFGWWSLFEDPDGNRFALVPRGQ